MPNDLTKQFMYISTGNPETENLPVADDPYPGLMGGFVTVKQPGPPGSPGAEEYRYKTYQRVRTDSSMTVTPYHGAVAWWQDKTNYTVSTDPTALGRGRVAGIFQYAITAGNIGFIQTRGPATVKFIDAPTAAPTAAGLIVIPSATAAKADCLAAGTAATYPSLGVSSEAVDGNMEAIVELDVPQTTP